MSYRRFHMMNRTLLFRSLVATSFVLFVISFFLPVELGVSNPSVAKLLRLDGYGAILTSGNSLLTSVIFCLWLLASIGLFLFQNWGRHLYLGLIMWSLVASLLYGIRISPPLGGALDLATNLLDGAILAMAYLPGTRELFSRSALSKNQPESKDAADPGQTTN